MTDTEAGTASEAPQQENAAPVATEVQEERTVPLKALEEERRKRQEAEARARLMAELSEKREAQSAPPPEDDGDDWVTRKDYRNSLNETKREILEDAYAQANPAAVSEVENYLPELIKSKPWVRDAIERSHNRVATAHEIVKEMVLSKQVDKSVSDAKRLIDNSQKPGSPALTGKGAGMSRMEIIKKAQGTSDWGDVRDKIRRGEL